MRPDETLKAYRFHAFIETPDGEAHMIFAYESNAITWIKDWCAQRGIPVPEIPSYGPVETGGEYLIK